jgi:hypothetical protein
MVGIPPIKISIVDMFYHRIYQVFEDEKSLSSLRANDVIYAFQLEAHPPQEKSEEQPQKSEEKENEDMKDEQQKDEKPSIYNLQVVHAKKGTSSQDLISFPFILTFSGDLTGKQLYQRVFDFVSKRYSKPNISFDDLPFTVHLIDQARDDFKQGNLIQNDETVIDFAKKKTLGNF